MLAHTIYVRTLNEWEPGYREEETAMDVSCCVTCSAKTAVVFGPYAVERGGKLVVVRGVPMYECDSCGETYLTTAVMKQLDELIAQLLTGNAAEAIVRYPVAA